MARTKKPTGQKRVEAIKATTDMSTVARKLLQGIDGHNGFQTENTNDPDLVRIRFSLHRQPQEVVLSKSAYSTAPNPVGYVERVLDLENRTEATEDRADAIAAKKRNEWNAYKKGTAKEERKKLKKLQQDSNPATYG